MAVGWFAAALAGTVVTAFAQEAGEAPALPMRDDLPMVVTVLSPLILPKLFADCYRLRDYIRSEEFRERRRAFGDIYAVDFVFDRALRLSWNNRGEALLITCFAVMDHARFGVRLPVLGMILWFPLTSEFTEDMVRRENALPTRLYPDTPRRATGDRDKLQHFFGSAFLTYCTESPESADRMGEFIEWGEERYIVGGVSDDRDVRANRQGQAFALRLLRDPDARPSALFLELFRAPSTLPGSGERGPDSLHVSPEAE